MVLNGDTDLPLLKKIRFGYYEIYRGQLQIHTRIKIVTQFRFITMLKVHVITGVHLMLYLEIEIGANIYFDKKSGIGTFQIYLREYI